MTSETYYDRKINGLSNPAARRFKRPSLPPKETIKRVHISAVCGKAMAPLAGLLVEKGYEVTGSDAQYSPPMSELLTRLNLSPHDFSADHLEGVDLVIIGNALGPDNVECTAARERGLPYLSVAEALSHLILEDQQSIVVAGTHGKTTTTGLLIKLFETGEKSPGFLVGGVVQGEETAYGLGAGTHFLIEGDEYDTAYFDKRPKFLHYGAKYLIVTSLELDHTDIYDGEEDYQQAFRYLVGDMPAEGRVYLCRDNQAAQLAPHCAAAVTTYGFHPDSDLRIVNHRVEDGQQYFDLLNQGTPFASLQTPLSGKYNCQNIAACFAVASQLGLDVAACQRAVRQFYGMKKRQELLARRSDDLLLIDDYAHHPTAVEATLNGLRKQYGPKRRLIALFEPRSNSSRRRDFEDQYPHSFHEADQVIIKAPAFRHNDDEANFLDPQQLIENIQKEQISATQYTNNQEILDFLKGYVQPTDLLVTMSNGNFDHLQEALIEVFGMERV